MTEGTHGGCLTFADYDLNPVNRVAQMFKQPLWKTQQDLITIQPENISARIPHLHQQVVSGIGKMVIPRYPVNNQMLVPERWDVIDCYAKMD
jgi:hypothetical protein